MSGDQGSLKIADVKVGDMADRPIQIDIAQLQQHGMTIREVKSGEIAGYNPIPIAGDSPESPNRALLLQKVLGSLKSTAR